MTRSTSAELTARRERCPGKRGASRGSSWSEVDPSRPSSFLCFFRSRATSRRNPRWNDRRRRLGTRGQSRATESAHRERKKERKKERKEGIIIACLRFLFLDSFVFFLVFLFLSLLSFRFTILLVSMNRFTLIGQRSIPRLITVVT